MADNVVIQYENAYRLGLGLLFLLGIIAGFVLTHGGIK